MTYIPLYLFVDLHYEPVFCGQEVEEEDDFIVEIKDYLKDCKGGVDVDI